MNPKPLVFLAVVFLSGTVFAQSERLVSGVPPEHPEVVEGIRAALQGDNEKADRFFDEALKKHPGSRPGGIDAAMAFTDSNFDFQFFGKMRFWLERTAENYPDDPEAYFLMADIAQFNHRYFECGMLARHGLAMVEKLDTNPPRQRSLRIYGEKVLANLAEQQERWPVAEAQYRKLVELEPDNAEHRFQLGVILYRLDKKDEARAALTEAQEKNEKLLPATIVLAQLAEGEGRSEEAEKYLEEALQKNARDDRVLCAAVDLELKWNRMEKAKVHAEKAEKIAPKSPEPLLRLGMLDLYNEKFEDAEDKFMTVNRSLPDEPRALTGLALALCEQKEARQLRRAFSLAKKNVENDPASVDAQVTLAWVLIRSNSPDEAEKILLRHFDAGELNSPGAYYYAVLLYGQNRRDEAKKFLHAALSTNNNFPKRAAATQLLQTLDPGSQIPALGR